ncbi:MAG: hypothetical protein IJ455_08575 [Agathobacter sp.]|nr:hypothetical protein [Agathobacter sp.]
MKKIKCFVALLILGLLFTGCSNEDEEKKGSFAALKEEISAEMAAAKEGKYENLNIVCDEVRLPEVEEIKEMKFPIYEFTSNMSLKEKLDFYKDVVYPKLLDLEEVDTACIMAGMGVLEDGTRKYGDYTYLMEHAEELEQDESIQLWMLYKDNENYYAIETMPEGICFNLSLGTLGRLSGRNSPFGASNYEEVKSYNCYLDDLSDSYPLMDGTQKTVAEAKAEIEEYLDAHYPLVGEDNGIRNEVYKIIVGKIPNTEYYVFDAYRTFSYEGIRVKEHTGAGAANEVGVMGQAFLCESNKVDILLGLVNCYEKGMVAKVYEAYMPFADVMEGLSYYMTGDTVFDILYIGMEYRMFTETEGDKSYDIWIPYWSFLLENPNDESAIRVYVNMETGEMESY